jgi:hypothetical protein
MDDTCANGVCTGMPASCTDDNPCTDDGCDPITGCTQTNNTAPCSDGNVCTVGDVCANGSCAPGTPVDCDDGNPCTTDGCDPKATIGCVHVNNTSPCDDGEPCTTGDVCGGGTCHGGGPTNCDDANICTTDLCTPGTGCVHNANGNLCNDGDACTTDDVCGGGACHGDTAVICDDGNTCSDDSCDSKTGCAYAPNGSCDASPVGRNYYRKLCKRLAGPERITQADVDCARRSCTFAGMATVDQLCQVLSRGDANVCGAAESYLLALLLDTCRGRIDDSFTVNSRCTDNTTVGQSREEADILLCNLQRTRGECKRARCETKEVKKRFGEPSGAAAGMEDTAVSTLAGDE